MNHNCNVYPHKDIPRAHIHSNERAALSPKIKEREHLESSAPHHRASQRAARFVEITFLRLIANYEWCRVPDRAYTFPPLPPVPHPPLVNYGFRLGGSRRDHEFNPIERERLHSAPDPSATANAAPDGQMVKVNGSINYGMVSGRARAWINGDSKLIKGALARTKAR